MTKASLRYALDFIPVTNIAEQWYCEKAVDLSFRYPNVVTRIPDLDIGTTGHQIIEQEAIPIEEEEFKEIIESNNPVALQESAFEGSYRRVKIKGVPDYVALRGRKANLLIEFKFSNQKRIFMNHRVQLNIYGFLLHKNRFDVRNLICGVVLFPLMSSFGGESGVLMELNEEGILQDVIKKMKRLSLRLKNTKSNSFVRKEYKNFISFLFPFSLDEAKKNLEWAVGYWLKARNVLPTTKSYKCKICPYNICDFCNAALSKPDRTRIKVRKRRVGKRFVYHVSRFQN